MSLSSTNLLWCQGIKDNEMRDNIKRTLRLMHSICEPDQEQEGQGGGGAGPFIPGFGPGTERVIEHADQEVG